jgi:glutamine amidotransferase
MSAPSLTIVDYGVGNLLSVRRAFEACGATVRLTDDPDEIGRAERLVLPGVGAFGDCMAELRRRDMVEPVTAYAGSGRPMRGICVGMQVLLSTGEEFGRHAGLALIPGTVSAIPATAADGRPHKIPHIGWSSLQPAGGAERWSDSVMRAVPSGASAYFVHSFTAVPDSDEHRLADCDYNGRRISAAIRRDNIVGMQFHPEKSGSVGLAMLSAFLAA